jgi:hypothetical protein
MEDGGWWMGLSLKAFGEGCCEFENLIGKEN